MSEELKSELKTLDDIEVKTEPVIEIKTKDDPLEKYRSPEHRDNPAIKEFRMFLKGIMYRRPDLIPERFKTASFMNEGTDSEGGYLVPEEWANKIYDNVGKFGVARSNATVLNMSRKELLIPKLSSLPAFSFVNEGVAKPLSIPTFSQLKLSRHDGGFITIFSKQLIEDEDFDVMTYVTDLAGKIIMKNMDDAAFRGLSPIVGLLQPETGLSSVVTSGGTFDTLDYDNIIDATVAIPSHNLANAKWYMSRSIWGFIKKLKYGNGPESQDEYIVSPEDRRQLTLEGYPVELTEGCYAMNETGRDKAILLFGDLKHLIIGERKGLTIDFSKEATVDDGNNTISLWQNGLVGLNFGVSFDMKCTFTDSMCIINTSQ
jgi:HK97 family phage major capsid protein